VVVALLLKYTGVEKPMCTVTVSDLMV